MMGILEKLGWADSYTLYISPNYRIQSKVYNIISMHTLHNASESISSISYTSPSRSFQVIGVLDLEAKGVLILYEGLWWPREERRSCIVSIDYSDLL